ncbi:uncharacterized protein PGTG_17265 [Puccinia graminis f. sp. tritici CRL 75-36-700-3]|uniref:Uncharacterized protein n=1 Tax=Puccinia graminis f. sp. tritici (strain CRL 75-36-700-3 / race SCCL) TaxID=418459 RepID=E3L368_PUCGT|nr:uncharacterized protein PGTG_17265 [Puccinia graminis f. sp. tritici CRL 75-36-700-3]EFP90993.2 hypothetical protein PGTG_17265 [Puccinia graminis f. sp. tritici CRL 75-36-700-3]
MSEISEVTVLRKELSNLRTPLETIESRIKSIPLAPVQLSSQISSRRLAKGEDKLQVHDKEETSRVSIKLRKTSSSRSKRNAQTLRSRSFKVMRHLINVVDILHVEGITSDSNKIHINRSSSCNPVACRSSAVKAKAAAKPKRALSLKEEAILSGSRNELDVSAISLPPITELGAPVNPKSAKKPPTLPKNLETTLSTSSETPRSLHPQVPCSATSLPATTEFQGPMKAESAKEPVGMPSRLETTLNTGSDSPRHLHPKRPRKVKLSNNSAALNQHSEVVLPKTAEMSTVTRTPAENMPEVTEYNRLQLRCGSFSLLKHDPAMLDLLPTSVKDKNFIATASMTNIENLPQASKMLIRRKILGIWEWKEGTSMARLHEYKTPEPGTTISNRSFKFVGFAWKGTLGQQPPRIEELHKDISQGADTLRWYWFKDLWLLFYFD